MYDYLMSFKENLFTDVCPYGFNFLLLHLLKLGLSADDEIWESVTPKEFEKVVFDCALAIYGEYMSLQP